MSNSQHMQHMQHNKALLATKRDGYIIEPVGRGPRSSWEGHHATNPTAIRLSTDARVFLGYRAGGDKDSYYLNTTPVWGSHLGLAVLDSRGERVIKRFPLPIFTVVTDITLPQTPEESQAYQSGPHRDEIVVFHDFRFWEDGEWLYVIYHEGSVSKVYDCIVRINTSRFLEKVDNAVDLLSRKPDNVDLASIRSEWARIWWADDVWQPCGVDGSNRIYPSDMNKNDIVFLRLNNGSLAMYHRPVPDIAFVLTDGQPFLTATSDGITTLGNLQTCIRPGYTDNSHIGNNGVPIRVNIGETTVAMDVVHGVHNEAISNARVKQKWKLHYFPYLRLLDCETGECLYYSQNPLLEYDKTWDEYARRGEWIKTLDHLDGVMFAGGQIEVERGKIGLDDFFTMYTGVGDTAVAAADFKLRDVLPKEVIEDIQTRSGHRKFLIRGDLAATAGENRFELPANCSGWNWHIKNDRSSGKLLICRELESANITGSETAECTVNTRPGYFDADWLYFDGASVQLFDGLGWVVQYLGGRWSEAGGVKRTVTGIGVFVLDRENPERVLYRSEEPLDGTGSEEAGWKFAGTEYVLPMSEDLVPERVKDEIGRIYENKPMPSDMTRWLLRKSGKTAT